MGTVLFPQAVGNGEVSNEFEITEPTLVVMTGAVNAVGARMHLQLKKFAGGMQYVGTLTGGMPSGTLQPGTYYAVRGGGASLGLEKGTD